MELVDDKLHRTLTYLSAAQKFGATVSLAALETFASQPVPFARQVSVFDFASAISAWERSYEREIAPAEKPVPFLIRVGWIDVTDAGVRLTELGRAVLAHADRPAVADTADGPIAVTIDPEDPLAYARLFDLLSSHGTGLLVDRYLKLQGLADILHISSVNRVLTGDDDNQNRLSLFGKAVGAIEASLDVRTVPAADLHDRFFIPDDGPVYVLGSSLNSIAKRPGVVTPVSDAAAAGAVRSAYADLWARSSALPGMPDIEADR